MDDPDEGFLVPHHRSYLWAGGAAVVGLVAGFLFFLIPSLLSAEFLDRPAPNRSVSKVQQDIDAVKIDLSSTGKRVSAVENSVTTIEKSLAVSDEHMRRFEQSTGESLATIREQLSTLTVALLRPPAAALPVVKKSPPKPKPPVTWQAAPR